jgi:hypothetical protein
MSSLILLFGLLVPGAGAVSAQPEELRMLMTVGERRFAVTLTDTPPPVRSQRNCR